MAGNVIVYRLMAKPKGNGWETSHDESRNGRSRICAVCIILCYEPVVAMRASTQRSRRFTRK
jgi:hypothetical protein